MTAPTGLVTDSVETLAEALLAACDPPVRDALARSVERHPDRPDLHDNVLLWAPGSLGDGQREARPLTLRKTLAALLASDWMKRHDAEVRAEALREAAEAVARRDDSHLLAALLALDCNETARQVADWVEDMLRDRAALAEESGR